MNRSELVLAAMASSNGVWHTPVQIQKLFFLIEREISAWVGSHFSFRADDYGPFDKTVYAELETLSRQGLVEISNSGMKKYRLTGVGQERGNQSLQSLHPDIAKYIGDISAWVRSLSFADLVSAIYKKYPEMRANSIFREF